MDGAKNLMVPRGEKSVWDKPTLTATLSTYDHDRWIAAAFGSALVMVGARRGGFGGGLVATLGIRDLVIVNTPDALLVADKNRAQDVSNIVRRLKQSNRREHAQHLRNLRPWGYFESLTTDARFQVKLLNVKPGAKLSLQMHHHRSEHWTVVQGTAKVTMGNTERLLGENEFGSSPPSRLASSAAMRQ